MKIYFTSDFSCFIVVTLALHCSVWIMVRSQDFNQGECGKDDLIRCVNPLQMLTNNKELSFVTSKKDLDSICPDLKQGLACIERYTKRCMSMEQKDHFNRLYAGTTIVIGDLCREGPYQQEFLQHAPCVQNVKSEYEKCATKYQQEIKDINYYSNSNSTQTENNRQVQTVCCSFQKYLRCSEGTVREKCGKDTAEFTKGFLDKMASSLIQIHCEKYPAGSDVCNTLSAGASAVSSFILLALLALLATQGGSLRT